MTIDINKLRRLAQAATPGPWYVTGKLTRYVEARIDGGLIQEVAACGPTKADGGYGPQQEANARLIAAANPATISELLDRLEAAEKDVTEAYRRGYATGQEEVEMIDRLDAKGRDQAMQDALMKFDPSTGEERPYPSHATQWRNWHGTAAWLFDPWTGKRRNAYDVGSDVHGLLIAPAGTLGMDMGGGCATTTEGVMNRAQGKSK